jgi:hypothetical protein
MKYVYHCIWTVPRAEPGPISRALARSAGGRSGGLAKARPNLGESAELQTDVAQARGHSLGTPSVIR